MGLPDAEVRPKFESLLKNTNSKLDKKYVCISEFASNEVKFWKEVGGWQKVVNYLKGLNFEVVVISKEKTKLENVIDFSGEFSLQDRMIDLYHCEFFIGVSSGLSWLAWSLGKKVLMISDGTHKGHEFKENCIRLCANNIDKVDFSNYENITTFKEVKCEIDKLINV